MSDKGDQNDARGGRMNWLDDQSHPLIQTYTEKLSTFLDAIADGKIDERELANQEARLITLLKKVEPELSDSLHADVTQLLCELTAYNVMQSVYELSVFRSRTTFRG